MPSAGAAGPLQLQASSLWAVHFNLHHIGTSIYPISYHNIIIFIINIYYVKILKNLSGHTLIYIGKNGCVIKFSRQSLYN
jgi:hypothetical protein